MAAKKVSAARKSARPNPPDRDGNGKPGGSLPGNETASEAKGEAPVSPNLVTNILPGTTLHLRNGRRLAYGESAEVDGAEAAYLRERGQVV